MLAVTAGRLKSKQEKQNGDPTIGAGDGVLSELRHSETDAAIAA
jgi:hypothetical protein